MAKSTKKLKKLDINLLEMRMKDQSTALTATGKASIDMELEKLLSSLNLLIFFGGFSLFLIMVMINLFIFVSNLSLKTQYRQKLLEAKPYSKEFDALNRSVSQLSSEYDRLNSAVTSFENMNHVFNEYYSIYRHSVDTITAVLHSVAGNYDYVDSISFNMSGQINPSSFTLTLKAETPSHIDNVMSNISREGDCYSAGVKGICIKTMIIDREMKTSHHRHAYFDTKINVSGDYVK